jgi:hypothetical protein
VIWTASANLGTQVDHVCFGRPQSDPAHQADGFGVWLAVTEPYRRSGEVPDAFHLIETLPEVIFM